MLATMSAKYKVHVRVNDKTLFGSPFPITIVNTILPISLGDSVVRRRADGRVG